MTYSGNLGWAESGAQPVTEPIAALKADGYANSAIPTSANWNWLMREHGRAAVQRFDNTEDLIRRQVSGTAPVEDVDFGIVLPAAPTQDNYTEVWAVTGDANQTDLVCDGEIIFYATSTAGATLTSKERVDGSNIVVGPFDSVPAAFDLNPPIIACAGGNVYGFSNPGVNLKIWALDRDTLTEVYSLATATAVTPTSVDTNGEYIAFTEGTNLYLYQDTGAAIVYTGIVALGGAGTSVRVYKDRVAVVVGGTVDVFGIPGLGAPIYSFAPVTVGAGVTELDFDGENAVAIEAGAGAGAHGAWFNLDSEATVAGRIIWNTNQINLVDCALLSEAAPGAGDVAIAESTNIYIYDRSVDWGAVLAGTGVFALPTKVISWGAAGGPLKLAWDGDALFAYGTPDAGGFRLKRYKIHDAARLYARQSASDVYRPIHSLVRPVR